MKNTIGRVAAILRKDFAVGPRSPLVLFAIAMPIIITLIMYLVFGISHDPHLGVVDQGNSELVAALQEIADAEGIQVTVLPSLQEAQLREAVNLNDYDAGLVLPAGFDEAVRAGQQPPLIFFVSGESGFMDRIVLAVTALEQIRHVQGKESSVQVEIVDVGNREAIPLSTRLIPVIAFYAFAIAGLFVPASSIVEEREHRTIQAVLVSPARVNEFLVAKAVFGMILAFCLAFLTLLLNQAVGPYWLDVAVVLFVTSIFWALLGVLVGTLAANSQTLFAIMKGSGVLMFGPVIFYIFPDWPQWIAKFFPTYWALDPLWRVVSNGSRLASLWPSLLIVVAICIALAALVHFTGQRMLRRISAS